MLKNVSEVVSCTRQCWLQHGCPVAVNSMRQVRINKLGSQPWYCVLAAGSRSQACTCCCVAGRMADVFEIYARHLPVSTHFLMHSLKWILQRIGSLCCAVRLGMTWSRTFSWWTRHAAAFCRDYRVFSVATLWVWNSLPVSCSYCALTDHVLTVAEDLLVQIEIHMST